MPLPSRQSNEVEGRQNSLSAHILPTSATMIGVCMTVLSIGHLGPSGDLRAIVDKLIAIDGVIFLSSAVLSFVSMRTHHRAARYEGRAEVLFISGLALLALAAVTLAFAIK